MHRISDQCSYERRRLVLSGCRCPWSSASVRGPSTSEAAALVQVSEGVHPDPDTAHPHRELLPSFGATAEAVETPPPWWDDPVHGGPLQDGQRREGR
jgi:hypothetical protein